MYRDIAEPWLFTSHAPAPCPREDMSLCSRKDLSLAQSRHATDGPHSHSPTAPITSVLAITIVVAAVVVTSGPGFNPGSRSPRIQWSSGEGSTSQGLACRAHLAG